MATIQTNLVIPSMKRTLGVHLYFPTDLPASVGNKVRGVITLLHGLIGGPSDWMMMTAAPRYAADNGYILVCPNADNSFYNDMAYGSDFYTGLTEELPALLGTMFHIPTERENNFIAGLSMGGYGALRIGLAHPERYAAIGAFSGALDMAAIAAAGAQIPSVKAMLAPVLGEALGVPDGVNLMHLAKGVSALPAAEQPRILCTCGRQDNDEMMIHIQNQNFRACAEALPLDYTYKEWDGVHEWNFWDRSLAEFIGFVQSSDYGLRKQGDWSAT